MVHGEPRTPEPRRFERQPSAAAARSEIAEGFPALALVGRILLAAIFFPSGISKIFGWSQTVGSVAAKGLPVPEVLLAIAIVVEIAGAVMLILGWYSRAAAAALAAFVLVAGLLYHDFWAADAAQYQNQFNHFMKNIGMIGGLLMVVALGPGRFAVNRS